MINFTRAGLKEGVLKHKKEIQEAIAIMEFIPISLYPASFWWWNLKLDKLAAQYKLRQPSHVAVSEGAKGSKGMRLYGIRGNYANGIAEVYFLYTGDKTVPIASEFTPTPVLTANKPQDLMRPN